MLKDLLEQRRHYVTRDDERFMDAVQNAHLVANAERYYRTMYYGSRASWNLRAGHMFETLKQLLDFYGARSKAIVWAHNSHIGGGDRDVFAWRTQSRHLCRREFGELVHAIGFGTNRGTVAAASDWDGPMEIKTVRPALAQSYENICHDSDVPNFLLDLHQSRLDGEDGLRKPRLERAIGVIYRPETERASHCFQATLPDQFNDYIWFEETSAVKPFATKEVEEMPDTYPFGM